MLLPLKIKRKLKYSFIHALISLLTKRNDIIELKFVTINIAQISLVECKFHNSIAQGFLGGTKKMEKICDIQC